MRLAAATLVPLLVLGGLELGLRLAGYGYPTTFFLPSRIGGKAFLIPNYKFSYRFFPPTLARKPVLFRMPVEKPPGTYRIFLFGESAAFGDPDPCYGVGRFLEVLLEERYPSTHFEVICVAMTAIDSHAILPIARECARHDGDLWIIYMGNNEMVGPYGASTVFGAKAPGVFLVRSSLALKSTRVGQLLDGLVRGLRSDTGAPRTWTGIDMFTKNPLQYDDAGRLRAYANFKANLDDILAAGREAGLPILLSTVASNLKDCSPFLSLHMPGLDAAELARWDEFYRQAQAFEAVGTHEAALECYSNAAAIDPGFAELQFRMGNCLLALTNRQQALEAFVQARDHDGLAVRADTRVNRIILKAARRQSRNQVYAADAAEALARRSPGGITGREFFYDHVHLTPEGNYELARIFAGTIAGILPSRMTEGRTADWADAEACDRRLGLSLWDQKRLWKEVLGRISVAPFTSQSSHTENMAYGEAEVKAIDSRITPDTPGQDRQMYEEALARAPEDVLLRGNYAQFLEATASRSEAIVQGQRVCELLPDLSWPYYYVGALMVRQGRIREAADCFQRALKIRSDFIQARQELQQIQARYPLAVGPAKP